MNKIEQRQAADRTLIAKSNDQERRNQRSNRRQFIAAAGTIVSGLIVLPWARSTYEQAKEPLPLFPTPTPEITPVLEVVDLSQKDAEFRLLSDMPLRELGIFNRDMIYDIVRRFAEFALPEEIAVRTNWRDDDGGYTKVTPGHIDISADLFRVISLDKKMAEIQHAAAELPFVNFVADPLGERYLDARGNGALSALEDLSTIYDGYKETIKNPLVKDDYKNGFYVFNEYTYIDDNHREKTDLSRQNGRMENGIADYCASVINTAMLQGADMAQRISDLPIQLNGVPGGMGIQGSYWSDSPEKILAREGYDKTIDFLRTLVKPDVRKPQDAPARLIRNLNGIYLTAHQDVQQNGEIGQEVNI